MMLKSISSKKSVGCSIGSATPEKIESLQLCQKSFELDSHTKESKKSHSKANKHECEFCKQIFTQNNNLQKHMRIHTGGKANLSLVNETTFAFTSSLKTYT